jgi:flagellar FliL protein
MADEKVEEKEEGAPEGGKSKKKLIIIIVIVLLAIGASVGVTIFLLKGGKPAPEKIDKPAVPVKKAAIYYDITPTNEPIIVTFEVDGGQRYLQAFISALVRDQKVADALELHKPVIRSRIISLYGSQDFKTLQTNKGKLDLQKATLNVVNKVLEEQKVNGKVEKILFTNFVMQ